MSTVNLIAVVRKHAGFRYLGLACFFQGAVMTHTPDALRVNLGRGELVRVGVVKVLNGHPCADIALGLLTRDLFESWPLVGGSNEPEEFVVDKHTYLDYPMFVGAFIAAWRRHSGSYAHISDATMYKTLRELKDFGGYCDVHVADTKGLEIGDYLSPAENIVANTLNGDSVGLLAIDAGLHYLGRRK
jgi:hypothetical protein